MCNVVNVSLYGGVWTLSLVSRDLRRMDNLTLQSSDTYGMPRYTDGASTQAVPRAIALSRSGKWVGGGPPTPWMGGGGVGLYAALQGAGIKDSAGGAKRALEGQRGARRPNARNQRRNSALRTQRCGGSSRKNSGVIPYGS